MALRPKRRLGKRIRRFIARVFIWGTGLAALGLAGLYGYIRHDFASAASELKYEMSRAKELAIPLSDSDFHRLTSVPSSENAAPIYREMAVRFAAIPEKEWSRTGDLAFALREGRPVDGFLLNERLERLKPILSLAVKGSQETECDFRREWSKGPSLAFPELRWMRAAAQWLTIRAVMKWQLDDKPGAIGDFAAAGRIAYHAGHDPILIAGLAQNGIFTNTIIGVERCASVSADDPKALAQLRKVISEWPEPSKLEPHLVGEAGMAYLTFRNFERHIDREFGQIWMPWPVKPPFISMDLIGRAYAARTLAFWNDLLTLQRASRWDSIAFANSAHLLEAKYANSQRPCDVLGAIMFPMFRQAGDSIAKAVAHRTATRALIEILAYRARHGRLPKTLLEAGFEEPDPFRDSSLGYIRTSRGFRIYSVGPDGRDDGGLFHWERPAADREKRLRDEPIAVFPASDRIDPNNQK